MTDSTLPEWFKQANKLADDIVEIVLSISGNRLPNNAQKGIRILCETYAAPVSDISAQALQDAAEVARIANNEKLYGKNWSKAAREIYISILALLPERP